eukprot:COSAG02_NODE_630_length_19310_cov_19.127271_4_plen_180_part_00
MPRSTGSRAASACLSVHLPMHAVLCCAVLCVCVCVCVCCVCVCVCVCVWAAAMDVWVAPLLFLPLSLCVRVCVRVCVCSLSLSLSLSLSVLCAVCCVLCAVRRVLIAHFLGALPDPHSALIRRTIPRLHHPQQRSQQLALRLNRTLGHPRPQPLQSDVTVTIVRPLTSAVTLSRYGLGF